MSAPGEQNDNAATKILTINSSEPQSMASNALKGINIINQQGEESKTINETTGMIM